MSVRESKPYVVRRLRSPASDRISFTVLGPDRRPSEPVERFLSWLHHTERSPNTIRAYAGDLCDFFGFLDQKSYEWDEITVDAVGEFTAWLRFPVAGVVPLPYITPRLTPQTVNRKLAAITSFYGFHRANGVELADALIDRNIVVRRPDFLAGFAPTLRGAPRGRLRVVRRHPQVLTISEVDLILRAQRSIRDRLLFALLFATGMRIGQALGLRHEDVRPWNNEIEIVPRDDNPNGARAKGGAAVLPVPLDLMRLWSDYMHEEYQDTDSDFLFVNLWGGTVGAPMRYSRVAEIVSRTQKQTGVVFTPHMFRHTYATLAQRNGLRIEVLSDLLTHRSTETTRSTYTHLNVEDVRRELMRIGVFDAVGDLL